MHACLINRFHQSWSHYTRGHTIREVTLYKEVTLYERSHSTKRSHYTRGHTIREVTLYKEVTLYTVEPRYSKPLNCITSLLQPRAQARIDSVTYIIFYIKNLP